jgi:hypothetical protein
VNLRLLGLGAALLLFAGCADAPTTPRLSESAVKGGKVARDIDVNQTFPIDFNIFNPCNGDIIVLVGTNHTLIHSTDASNGKILIGASMTINMDGIGANTGLKYNFTEVTRYSTKTGDPFPMIEDFYDSIHIVSQTSSNNLTTTLHVKLTINANGLPTAEYEHDDARCVG